MGRRAGSRARLVVAASLGVVVLTAGCGGSSGGTANGPTASQTETSSSQSPSGSAKTSGTSDTPTPTPTPTRTKKKHNVIAWILSLGPGAPDGPPEFTAYRELQQLRCSRVFDRVGELKEPAQTLYTGAARACLAAFSGRGDLWPGAAAAHDAVAGRSGELNCMDLAALALLERLVTLHNQHPDRSFLSASTSQAQAPPCPTIGGLTPDHGPAGTVVRMTGQHLGGNVVGVDVVDSLGNSQPAEGVTEVGGDLEFTMPQAPPAGASSLACIVVRASPDWSADGAMFTYESETAGSPTTFACPSAGTG
jgi:hypothetical protein